MTSDGSQENPHSFISFDEENLKISVDSYDISLVNDYELQIKVSTPESYSFTPMIDSTQVEIQVIFTCN